jgi:hypothetical protein
LSMEIFDFNFFIKIFWYINLNIIVVNWVLKFLKILWGIW